MAKQIEVEVLKPLRIPGKKTIQPGTEGISFPEGKELEALVTAEAVKKVNQGDKK